MHFTDILIPFLTFLLGALLAAIWFMIKFSDRLAILETNQKNVIQTLNGISQAVKDIKVDAPPCSFHIALDKEVVQLKTIVDAHLKAYPIQES